MNDRGLQNYHTTFLVPVYNAENTIEETLDSIVKQSIHAPYQIIIIDDGSTDQSFEKIEMWGNKQRESSECQLLMLRQGRGGEAAAINAGLAQAQGEYVAWVESDVCLHEKWFVDVLQEFHDERCAGVGGLLLPAEDDPGLAKILGYEIAFKMQLDGEHVKHITSANAIYRREIFSQLGECTVHLGASSFDSEYNHRIRENGWLLKRNLKAIAWHHYKTGITDCFVRTFWYGFRRPNVKTQILYQADRWIGLLVLLSILVPLALLYAVFDPFWGLLIAAGGLFAHFFYGWILYYYFRYIPLLWSGFVFWVRNITFFMAYSLGGLGLLYTMWIRKQ